MVFSSVIFLFIYLPVTLLVYYIAPVKWRNIWLFVVNLVFYAWGEPVYVSLMVFSLIINYTCGLLIEKKRGEVKKMRLVLAIGVAINLALLLVFKYLDLFATSLSAIPGIDISKPGLSLPIGISFYTFQSMSYIIDVYRNDAGAQKNFISYGVFISLFPQLIAGPIVRYKDIESQLNHRKTSMDQFSSGVTRFVIGLGKKILIADSIAMLWDIYSVSPAGELTMLGAWLGALAFTIQIYFDFSGYSDMAIGLGRMLGFEFLENFNYPYISKSVTEFWRRWHMSLGGWFRDYVYIPLGGNRCSIYRQFFNILAVWALTGFWHGASWTFLLWGLYYAVFLMLEKAFLLKFLEKLPGFIGHVYALLVAVCGWMLFQLPTLTDCVSYLQAMFGMGSAGLMASTDLFYLSEYALTFIVAILAATPLGKTIYEKIPAKFILTPILIALVLILSTAFMVDATYSPFLYFRF